MDRNLRALSLDFPRHIPTLLADAAVSLETGREDRATSLLDTVLRIEPDNVEAVLMATEIATYRGDLAGAHRRIRTALQQRPDEPLLYESQAATFFVEERFGESLGALAKADALAGTTSWRSHYHRGLVAESQGNAVSAIEHFDHCLDLAPDYEPAARRLRALAAR
jgi:predicted Zn-dependent protease